MSPAEFRAEVEAVLGRHRKVALQFSGGKDSMACLYLLRPWLDWITVYWVNTGDALPETVEAIERCRAFIPHFEEIRSDALAWRAEHGMPSDLVPTFATPMGRLFGMSEAKVVDRFTCCTANVMLPMFERMKADGVTCIIRGQKLADAAKVPLRSGDVSDGFEFFYPIERWSHQDVLDYLRAQDAPLHACYELGSVGVDCAHCTAWWDESHFEFIRLRHPELHAEVMRDVSQIRKLVAVHARHLNAALDRSKGD